MNARHTFISKAANIFLQKVIYISASQIHVSNDHKMVVESQRKPKLRSERRHTATGTNGLTIKEIEVKIL